MAEPIPLTLPPRDPRAELYSRLQNAPLDHAEAILAAYEVLQGLQDRGVLELLRGTLGASDKIIEDISRALKSPEAVCAIRNLVILSRALAAVEPERLQSLLSMVQETVVKPGFEQTEPPGLWALVKKLGTRDARRAIAALTSLLDRLGKFLSHH